MGRRQKTYTLIIAPNTPHRVKQFRISLTQIYTVLFSVAVVSFLSVFAFFRYMDTTTKLSSFEQLIFSHNRLKEENLQYKERTLQLAEKLANLEIVAKNISRLTGIELDSPSTGGIGGFTGDRSGAKDRLSLKPDLLDNLNQKSKNLETQVLVLKDNALEQNLFLSSMPTAWPVRGYLGSAFGFRPDPVSGHREFHEGLDICAPIGTQVQAPADGVVVFAGAQRGYGYTIVISHKYGITTRYAHLSAFNIKVGQRTKKHDIIGYIGNTGRTTGPHLHFEVLIENRPVNPARFLTENSDS